MKRIALAAVMAVSLALTAGETGDAPAPNPVPAPAPKTQCQCWAATQSGTRCKRRARPGERYCKQHSSSVAPKRAPERCMSITDDGAQCAEKPMDGKRYCHRHL